MTKEIPLPSIVDDEFISTNGYLSAYVGKSDKYIEEDRECAVRADIDDLEFLNHVIKVGNKTTIYTLRYSDLQQLNEKYKDKYFSLQDDYQNKDRSYIDAREFNNNTIQIPLPYVMWNPVFVDAINVNCIRNKIAIFINSNGNNKISMKSLLKLKETLYELKDTATTDIEKVILISNYLQSKVQYVEPSGHTMVDGKIYYAKCDKSLLTREGVGSIESVINHNCGLCMAISNTTTLLLNNPILDINTRTVRNNDHVWNLVNIDSKNYYVDNTWCITRNDNKISDILQAAEFSDKYLLFGTDTANNIGHHSDVCSYVPSMEREDYNKEKINQSEKFLENKVFFKYK